MAVKKLGTVDEGPGDVHPVLAAFHHHRLGRRSGGFAGPGCGDSFGGGFIGHISKTKDLSEKNLRKAVIYGSVIASYNAEDFSLERQKRLTWGEIEKRVYQMREMTEF